MEQVRLKEPGAVEVTFHHLLCDPDSNVRYHRQSMEIGLFPRDEYRAAFADTGLTVVEKYAGPDVRGGAFIGRRS
jgi:hypothetical protein